ncbi:pyrophosphatase [Candidatus Dependentiae bacterium]|nr:pyrophosphatase [Candidatus Dependentiae bacterium]
MFTDKLKNFIKDQEHRVQKYYKIEDKKIFALIGMNKLTEEIGELAREILASQKIRHKDKVNNHNTETLSLEFADVIITTLILAQTTGIDLEKALKIKIEKVTKKYDNL